MTPKHKNADILSAILCLRDGLPLKIETKHVKGHQDDDTSINELPPEAQWNVKMDASAKQLLQTFITCPALIPKCSPHPSSFPTCRWNGKSITQQLSNTLYYNITHRKMISYWIEKKRVLPDAVPFIDFEAMSSTKSFPLYLQRFATKWAAECLATGKNMIRWAKRHEGYCPFCTSPNEDTAHIMSCTSPDALQQWDEIIADFFKKLRRYKTCGQLHYALFEDIQAWRYGLPLPDLDDYSQSLQQAVQEQRRIGWKQFFEGLFSKQWARHMNTFYIAQGNYHTSNKWIRRLTRLAWEVSYKVWESRNSQLHKTQHIQDMEGVPILKQSITNEWKQGLGCLPASEFSSFFSPTLDHILTKSEDYLKQWLLTVRQGRLLLDPRHLIHDEFETSPALRDWVGISYSISDAEVLPHLKNACDREYSIGLGNLPHQFQHLFRPSKSHLLQKSISQQKQWLQKVRNGRVLFDPSNLLEDVFSNPGLFQDWLQIE